MTKFNRSYWKHKNSSLETSFLIGLSEDEKKKIKDEKIKLKAEEENKERTLFEELIKNYSIDLEFINFDCTCLGVKKDMREKFEKEFIFKKMGHHHRGNVWWYSYKINTKINGNRKDLQK